MPETFEEQLSRVEAIASGRRYQWDMDYADVEAIKSVLQALKESNAMCKDLAEQLKAVTKAARQ